MGKEALIVDDVSMKFNLSSEKVDNIKEYIIKSIKRQISYDEFWSLKHVSFSLDKGDRLGILGLNGAGKSTLLKVISGVYKPTEGHVIKHGKVVPLLELGAGFDAPPTDNTSSRIRISGFAIVAIENPNFDFIPDE